MLLRNFALLVGMALAANVGMAQACSSRDPPQSREQLFARASAVFTAHLMRTEESSAVTPLLADPMPVVEAAFRTIEIFKGVPPPDGKVKSLVFGPGNCSVPLLAGSDYLFFLYESDANFVLMLPGGSQLVWNLEGDESKKILGELRELAKRAPVDAAQPSPR